MQCLDETDGYTETDCRDSLLRDYRSGKAWIIANNCTRLIQSALQHSPIYKKKHIFISEHTKKLEKLS